MRIVALLSLAAALAQAPAPSEPPQPSRASPPVFPTGVELVAIDLSVVDEQGRPVRDLGPADFQVTVKGKPRRVVSVEFIEQTGEAPEVLPSPAPTHFSTNERLVQGRLVLIVVDENNIRFGSGRDVARKADALLERLGPGDRVGLMAIPGPHPREEFTTDHELIREALRKVVGRRHFAGKRVTLTEALAYKEHEDVFYWEQAVQRECGSDEMCERELAGEAFQVWAEHQEQSTRSIQTLRGALDVLKRVEGRKVLVLIAQGLGLPGTGPRLMIPPALRDLGTAAREARVSLYIVQVAHDIFPEMTSNLKATDLFEDERLLEHGLDSFADFAGGTVLRGTPESAFQRIAREIAGYYLVGFEPAESDRDGKEHDVRVKLARPGLTVRARPQITIPEAGKPSDEGAAVRAALSAPVIESGIPLRAASWSLRDVETGKVRVVLGAEIGGETPPSSMTVGFALFGDKGKSVAGGIQATRPRQEGASGPHRFETAAVVDPGSYTLRVAARDARGRQGSVDHPVSALLAQAGPYEASDLLVGTAPPAGQSFHPALDPVVTSEGVLATHMELYAREESPGEVDVWLDVIQAATATTVRTVRARVSPARQPGRLLAQALVPATGLGAGDYVIRANVLRGTEPLGSVARPFRVVER
jgi:VWFA-related protein